MHIVLPFTCDHMRCVLLLLLLLVVLVAGNHVPVFDTPLFRPFQVASDGHSIMTGRIEVQLGHGCALPANYVPANAKSKCYADTSAVFDRDLALLLALNGQVSTCEIKLRSLDLSKISAAVGGLLEAATLGHPVWSKVRPLPGPNNIDRLLKFLSECPWLVLLEGRDYDPPVVTTDDYNRLPVTVATLKKKNQVIAGLQPSDGIPPVPAPVREVDLNAPLSGVFLPKNEVEAPVSTTAKRNTIGLTRRDAITDIIGTSQNIVAHVGSTCTSPYTGIDNCFDTAQAMEDALAQVKYDNDHGENTECSIYRCTYYPMAVTYAILQNPANVTYIDADTNQSTTVNYTALWGSAQADLVQAYNTCKYRITGGGDVYDPTSISNILYTQPSYPVCFKVRIGTNEFRRDHNWHSTAAIDSSLAHHLRVTEDNAGHREDKKLQTFVRAFAGIFTDMHHVSEHGHEHLLHRELQTAPVEETDEVEAIEYTPSE